MPAHDGTGPVDCRKRQTATATPAKPGDLPWTLALALRGVAAGDLEYRAFFDLENERFYRGESTKTITKRVESGDAFLVPLSDIVITEESGAKAKTKNIQNIIDDLKEQNNLGTLHYI